MKKNNDDNNIMILYAFILLMIITLTMHYFNIINEINELREIKKINYIEILYGTNSFITVKNDKLGDQYNLTYGELTWTGMKNISNYCDRKGILKENFIDLGSGNGKSLAYAIYGGFKNAKGTEIVKERYDYAVSAREKMDYNIKNKINLSNSDIFELNSNYFPPNSVIFISNIMYPNKTNQELIKHLSKITSKGVIVILSKLPNNLYEFKLVEELNIPMSWDLNSKCYIIKK
jgi:predicted nicotinamide N-methyase